MKTIVTGADGFVGRNVVKQLVKDGVDVIPTCKTNKDNKLGLPFVTVDITKEKDFDKLPQEGVETIVHCAGLLSIDSSKYTVKDYIDANMIGTYNVLEYARKTNVKKVIFTMTHSDTNFVDATIIKEETPRKFAGCLPYTVSKIGALNFIDGYSLKYGIQGISLRLPGVRGYGSRDTLYNCVFHQFVQKAIKGEPIEIWGEHTTCRDMVYIKDVVAAIIGAMKSDKAIGLYNIGSGKGLTIEDEAKAIIKVFSSPDNVSKLVYRPDIPEVRKKSWWFDISKAKKDFGYSPQYNYEQAMADYKLEMLEK